MLKKSFSLTPVYGLSIIVAGVLLALAAFFSVEKWINIFSAVSVVLVFVGLVIYVFALRRSGRY